MVINEDTFECINRINDFLHDDTEVINDIKQQKMMATLERHGYVNMVPFTILLSKHFNMGYEEILQTEPKKFFSDRELTDDFYNKILRTQKLKTILKNNK